MKGLWTWWKRSTVAKWRQTMKTNLTSYKGRARCRVRRKQKKNTLYNAKLVLTRYLGASLPQPTFSSPPPLVTFIHSAHLTDWGLWGLQGECITQTQSYRSHFFDEVTNFARCTKDASKTCADC